MQETIIVNILGGPGIGKSTCALQVVAEIKKQGYQAEYVQEVAKELVYAGDMEHLNGSLENQAYILSKQKERLDLLVGQVDFVITDSPLPLNLIYLKEHNEYYETEVLREFNTYKNINIVLGRNLAVEYQNEGRIHTLEESLVKDKEIVELLEKNSLPYRSFERSDISGIIEYITSEEQQRDNSSKLTLSSEEIEDIAKKIQQNAYEDELFKGTLNLMLDGDKRTQSQPLTIGTTTYALALCEADSTLPLTIQKRVIDKAMRPEIRDENGRLIGKTGHGLTKEQLLSSLFELKSPSMILEGNRDNSLLAVTSTKDIKNRYIVIAIELNQKEGFRYVNCVLSPYGRDNLSEYYDNHKLIAINKEKANDVLRSIGKSYPKENSLISFDNSIAYSLKNVKYPEEKSSAPSCERIVIDTETTGLSPFGGDELLQVSIINTEGTVLYNEYVKPTAHEAWEAAMAVNNITPEMVAGAKTIEEQLSEISKITLNAKEIIGYNTYFDINFLSVAGVEFSDTVKVTDVKADFTERHGVWDKYKGDFKWIKLTECAEHYGYDWNSNEGQAHNSVSDCFATLHCYNEFRKEIEREREEQQARKAQRAEKYAMTLQNDKVRIYVDMDGTLARFHDEVKYLERMWEEGFFEQLKPFQEMVDGIKLLKQQNPNAEVFILSAAIEGEPPYCQRQKHEWLDRYLPEIDKEHRIFTKIGTPKADYIKGGVKMTDILIDDYNKGLEEWQRFGGTAVKCHNNINHKGLIGKLWDGKIIHNFEAPEKICKDIVQIANSLPGTSGQGEALKRTASPVRHKEQEQSHRKR